MILPPEFRWPTINTIRFGTVRTCQWTEPINRTTLTFLLRIVHVEWMTVTTELSDSPKHHQRVMVFVLVALIAETEFTDFIVDNCGRVTTGDTVLIDI